MTPLIEQSGLGSFESSKDPRLGIIAARVKCWAPDRLSALNSPALDIGLNIPEWNPRQVSRRAGGEQEGYDVILSYEGHPNPDDAKEESFGFEGSTSEDPIETHWNFEVLFKNYGGTYDGNGRVKWPRKIRDKNEQTGRNRMYGTESWPRPGMIWNHNFVTRSLPDNLIRELGTISRTVPGNGPALSGDRDWLNIRVRGTQRGNIWQIQRSWEVSAPGGSIPEMYAFVR